MQIWIDSTRPCVVIADYGDRLFVVPNPGGWQLKREIQLDATLGRARFQCAKRDLIELLNIPPTLPAELEPTANVFPSEPYRIVRNGRAKVVDPAQTVTALKELIGKRCRENAVRMDAAAKAKREAWERENFQPHRDY